MTLYCCILPQNVTIWLINIIYAQFILHIYPTCKLQRYIMILKNMHNQSRGPGTSPPAGGSRGGTSPPAGGGRGGTSPPVGGGRGHEVGTRPLVVVVVEGFCIHLLLGFQSTYCWGSSPPTARVRVNLCRVSSPHAAGVRVHLLLGFKSTCWDSSPPAAGVQVHLLPGFKSTCCWGSSPPTAGVQVHLLPGFESTCCCFETWAISFTSHCLCLLEETLKEIGPGKWKKPVLNPQSQWSRSTKTHPGPASAATKLALIME